MRWLVRLGTMAAAAGCGGTAEIATPSPPTPTGPSTKIASLTIRDSVQAVFATPMVVTVTDSLGHSPRAVPVTVSAVYTSTAAAIPSYAAPLFFSAIKEQFGVSTVTVPTDSLGRVQVWLRGDLWSGTVRIRVSSRFGRDSLDGVLLAGHSHHFAAGTRDTALFVGGSFVSSLAAVDREGNLTGEAVSLTPRRPSVLDATGQSIVARATGRAYVALTAGEARDSIGVSVVPFGNLIAYMHASASNDRPAFFMFALDGSGYRNIGPSQNGYNTRGPQWSTALQRLIYHEYAPTAGNQYALSLMSFLLTGTPSLVLPADVVAVGGSAAQEYASATEPSVTLDGSWIYFAGTVGYNETGIWRVRPNGTGAARIGPATSVGTNDAQPSVAPDGRHVVYITDRGNFASGATRLMLLDVSTGVSLSMATLGTHPSWSPAGDEIAFFANGLSVVRPDGTGETVLATGLFDTRDALIAWSPDAKWIVTCVTSQASGDRQIVLIERATGAVLPLVFTAKDKLCEATWKP